MGSLAVVGRYTGLDTDVVSLVIAHPPHLPPLAYVECEPLRWKMMPHLTCHLTCHPGDKRLVDTGVVRGIEPRGSQHQISTL